MIRYAMTTFLLQVLHHTVSVQTTSIPRSTEAGFTGCNVLPILFSKRGDLQTTQAKHPLQTGMGSLVDDGTLPSFTTLF